MLAAANFATRCCARFTSAGRRAPDLKDLVSDGWTHSATGVRARADQVSACNPRCLACRRPPQDKASKAMSHNHFPKSAFLRRLSHYSRLQQWIKTQNEVNKIIKVACRGSHSSSPSRARALSLSLLCSLSLSLSLSLLCSCSALLSSPLSLSGSYLCVCVLDPIWFSAL